MGAELPVKEETLKVAPKAPVFYLVYSLPGRATVRVALEPDAQVVFGRAAGAEVTVTVDDPRVSRRHAEVRRTSQGVTVRDLGSSNGTVVCGEVLRDGERRMGAGDVFSVGPMQAVVASASGELVVADTAMRKLHAAVQRVARRDTPVLLLGEPGVGKKVIAERIHDMSPRAEKPYVVFRCGSVPEARVEEVVFGGARGAASLLETARGGSLLLADVELLPRGAQDRLLRLLRAEATGPGKKAAGSDVRVLCASSADLRAAVDAGDFDERLYALVATLAIRVPPLRDRKTEIPVLADHLLREIAEPLGVAAPEVTPEASRLLGEFSWPRNVSDLRDVMEYALALSDDGTIGPSELPVSFTDAARAADTPPARPSGQRVVLRIAAEGLSFCLPPGPIVSLSRRGPLRRVLLRLADEHERQRGSAITAEDLFVAGWPGEKPVGQSADGRVRTAVWMLRRMGLHDLLATRDDGYLLETDVAIERT